MKRKSARITHDTESTITTVALGNSLDNSIDKELATSTLNEQSDHGHRYGNFHNYYNFHPVSDRILNMSEIFDYIANEWNRENNTNQNIKLFSYKDIGCNSGDLTLEVARCLCERILHGLNTTTCDAMVTGASHIIPCVQVRGIDLDVQLIDRAKSKALQFVNLHPNIDATFEVVDVLKTSVKQDGTISTQHTIYESDFTTLFSTTMWIHIHGGDEGLRHVLQNICFSTSRWILIEPQLSKCYGTAAFRMRRLGLDPVDVSSDRLHLRLNAEESIDTILYENGFKRVNLEDNHNCDGQATTNNEMNGKEIRTPWKRSLRLYRRVCT